MNFYEKQNFINLLGGSGEIGRNKILLPDPKYEVKIFLDF